MSVGVPANSSRVTSHSHRRRLSGKTAHLPTILSDSGVNLGSAVADGNAMSVGVLANSGQAASLPPNRNNFHESQPERWSDQRPRSQAGKPWLDGKSRNDMLAVDEVGARREGGSVWLAGQLGSTGSLGLASLFWVDCLQSLTKGEDG